MSIFSGGGQDARGVEGLTEEANPLLDGEAEAIALKRPPLIKNSLLLTGSNLARVVTSVVLDMIIAALYGVGAKTDALFVALTIPEFVYQLLIYSYGSVLVPVFTATFKAEGRKQTWRLFSLVANLNSLALLATTLLGVAFSPFLIPLIAPGLEEASKSLAVGLSVILFLTLVPAGLIAVLQSMVNAFHDFTSPAIASPIRFILASLTILSLHHRLGISSVAVGYVVGTLGQMAVLVVGVAAKGASYQFIFDPRTPEVRQVANLIGVQLGASALRQSGVIFERFLASFLPPGTVAALGYARRISLAIYNVFAYSVSTALMPSLSASALRKDISAVTKEVALGLKLISLLVFPAVAGMVVLSKPIIRLLLERGAFSGEATAFTASLLAIYVCSIPTLAMVQTLLAPHFATKDVKTPAIHMSLMLMVNLLLYLALVGPLGAYGLALAYSLTGLLSALRAFWILRPKVEPLRIGGYLLRVGLATLLMGVVVVIVRDRLYGSFPAVNRAQQAVQVGAVALLGIIIYGLSILLLDWRGVRGLLHQVGGEKVPGEGR